MKHECSLCLLDNGICKTHKTFRELLFGKVMDCYIFKDYQTNIAKNNKIKQKTKKELIQKCK